MTIIPIVGKLSDLFGRKGFLIGGTSLFLLGSLLAGASRSMDGAWQRWLRNWAIEHTIRAVGHKLRPKEGSAVLF